MDQRHPRPLLKGFLLPPKHPKSAQSYSQPSAAHGDMVIETKMARHIKGLTIQIRATAEY